MRPPCSSLVDHLTDSTPNSPPSSHVDPPAPPSPPRGRRLTEITTSAQHPDEHPSLGPNGLGISVPFADEDRITDWRASAEPAGTSRAILRSASTRPPLAAIPSQAAAIVGFRAHRGNPQSLTLANLTTRQPSDRSANRLPGVPHHQRSRRLSQTGTGVLPPVPRSGLTLSRPPVLADVPQEIRYIPIRDASGRLHWPRHLLRRFDEEPSEPSMLRGIVSQGESGTDSWATESPGTGESESHMSRRPVSQGFSSPVSSGTIAFMRNIYVHPPRPAPAPPRMPVLPFRRHSGPVDTVTASSARPTPVDAGHSTVTTLPTTAALDPPVRRPRSPTSSGRRRRNSYPDVPTDHGYGEVTARFFGFQFSPFSHVTYSATPSSEAAIQPAEPNLQPVESDASWSTSPYSGSDIGDLPTGIPGDFDEAMEHLMRWTRAERHARGEIARVETHLGVLRARHEIHLMHAARAHTGAADGDAETEDTLGWRLLRYEIINTREALARLRRQSAGRTAAVRSPSDDAHVSTTEAQDGRGPVDQLRRLQDTYHNLRGYFFNELVDRILHVVQQAFDESVRAELGGLRLYEEDMTQAERETREAEVVRIQRTYVEHHRMRQLTASDTQLWRAQDDFYEKLMQCDVDRARAHPDDFVSRSSWGNLRAHHRSASVPGPDHDLSLRQRTRDDQKRAYQVAAAYENKDLLWHWNYLTFDHLLRCEKYWLWTIHQPRDGSDPYVVRRSDSREDRPTSWPLGSKPNHKYYINEVSASEASSGLQAGSSYTSASVAGINDVIHDPAPPPRPYVSSGPVYQLRTVSRDAEPSSGSALRIELSGEHLDDTARRRQEDDDRRETQDAQWSPSSAYENSSEGTRPTWVRRGRSREISTAGGRRESHLASGEETQREGREAIGPGHFRAFEANAVMGDLNRPMRRLASPRGSVEIAVSIASVPNQSVESIPSVARSGRSGSHSAGRVHRRSPPTHMAASEQIEEADPVVLATNPPPASQLSAEPSPRARTEDTHIGEALPDVSEFYLGERGHLQRPVRLQHPMPRPWMPNNLLPAPDITATGFATLGHGLPFVRHYSRPFPPRAPLPEMPDPFRTGDTPDEDRPSSSRADFRPRSAARSDTRSDSPDSPRRRSPPLLAALAHLSVPPGTLPPAPHRSPSPILPRRRLVSRTIPLRDVHQAVDPEPIARVARPAVSDVPEPVGPVPGPAESPTADAPAPAPHTEPNTPLVQAGPTPAMTVTNFSPAQGDVFSPEMAASPSPMRSVPISPSALRRSSTARPVDMSHAASTTRDDAPDIAAEGDEESSPLFRRPNSLGLRMDKIEAALTEETARRRTERNEGGPSGPGQ